MKCNKCGNEVDSGGKFCNICGTPVEQLDFQDENKEDTYIDNTKEPVKDEAISQAQPAKNSKSSFKAIGLLAVGIIAIFLIISALSGGNSESNENVEWVKNGHFFEYPEEQGYPTIGWSFENFFDDTSWEGFTADTGQEIVEFNGRCLYLDEEIDCTIQFEIYENSFDIYTITFNKIPQNNLMMNGIIEKVMEDAWDDSNY